MTCGANVTGSLRSTHSRPNCPIHENAVRRRQVRMKDDYGYFGKGTTGYVHYMEAFRRNSNGGGNKPRGKNGCLSTLLIMIVMAFLTHLL